MPLNNYIIKQKDHVKNKILEATKVKIEAIEKYFKKNNINFETIKLEELYVIFKKILIKIIIIFMFFNYFSMMKN